MRLHGEGLVKKYGSRTVVRGVSVEVFQGEIVGLLGPNGAGKTTLIRLLSGILEPSGGQILLDETPIAAMGENYRARLGYLPQHFGSYPNFTAMDFLLYMAAVKGLPKPYARAEAEELLEKVRLAPEAKNKIRTFSGGMKQRLGIAQAMQGNPDLLILDEPTAGLDPKERIYFRNMIAGYAQDKIVLLSTHIVADVESVASRVLVMKQGRILHSGAPADILSAVSGKVWECVLPHREAEELSARYPVTGFRHEGGRAFVRVVADQPPCENAMPAHPGLEDLYLYYFSEEGAGYEPTDRI